MKNDVLSSWNNKNVCFDNEWAFYTTERWNNKTIYYNDWILSSANNMMTYELMNLLITNDCHCLVVIIKNFTWKYQVTYDCIVILTL